MISYLNINTVVTSISIVVIFNLIVETYYTRVNIVSNTMHFLFKGAFFVTYHSTKLASVFLNIPKSHMYAYTCKLKLYCGTVGWDAEKLIPQSHWSLHAYRWYCGTIQKTHPK